MPKEAIWDLKPHTSVKHDLLRGYLSAWFPILNKFNRRVVFIDGFAGPGTYANGEPGSPIIALTTFLDHGYAANMTGTEYVFVFNEQHAARHESLESLLESERARRGDWPANVKVVVENKNFKDVAEDILAGLGSKSLAPTFAFVDPFGYKDVPMNLIKRLMSYSKSELFIYLDINSLTRFATAGNVDTHFEELFGTDEFKGAPSAGTPGRQQFLHDLYARQLKKECGFDFVQSFEMVGANGKTINYMFFCTRSLLGLDKMKSVMWKSAPTGDYRFIDRLDGQEVLFQEEVDTAPLRDALLVAFSGRSVTVDTLEEFVTSKTPFVKSHLRRATLVPLQKSGHIASPNQRKTGTFPPGTIVTFPGEVVEDGSRSPRPSFS